jgi:hypothetical protein
MALVMVRTGGAWLEQGKLVLPDEKGRAKNIEWAVRQLRLRAGASPKVAAYRVDLGEALEVNAENRAEAKQILEALMVDKLAATAHAYAALARLRGDSGDHEGAESALKECKVRNRQEGVCQLERMSPPAKQKESEKKGKA